MVIKFLFFYSLEDFNFIIEYFIFRNVVVYILVVVFKDGKWIEIINKNKEKNKYWINLSKE